MCVWWWKNLWPQNHWNSKINVLIWFKHWAQTQQWMIFALVCNLLAPLLFLLMLITIVVFVVSTVVVLLAVSVDNIHWCCVVDFLSLFRMESARWTSLSVVWLCVFFVLILMFLYFIYFFLFHFDANLNTHKKKKKRKIASIGNWNEDIFRTHVTFGAFISFHRSIIVQQFKSDRSVFYFTVLEFVRSFVWWVRFHCVWLFLLVVSLEIFIRQYMYVHTNIKYCVSMHIHICELW